MADKQEYELKDDALDEVAGGVGFSSVVDAVAGFWARLIAFFKRTSGTSSATRIGIDAGIAPTETLPGQNPGVMNDLVAGPAQNGSVNDLVGGTANPGSINDLTAGGSDHAQL